DSIQNQTCPRWQLCLADASDEEHGYVGQLVAKRGDDRIRYVKISNEGIAANTNAAAKLAEGEYMALADHDDILAPHAVYMMGKAIKESGATFLYSDEALFSSTIEKARVGHFKPEYAPAYFLSCNYLCHLAVFKRSLFEEVGGERPECDGSQDYDLFLRLVEKSGKPCHVPHVLYYWRVHEASTSGGNSAKPYVEKAAMKALSDHLERTGQKGTVKGGRCPGTYKIDWELESEPLVSILIPNKDHVEDLKKCLDSIYAKTAYKNFEILVLENNSTEEETFAFYKTLPETYPGCRVEWFEGGFNFSALNNFGRAHAKGEYLLMLNNDVEVIGGEWLGEMVKQTSRPGVGICGAMLYYEDDTVQHGGIITGLGGYAGHSHKYHRRGGSGYMFRLCTVQDFSAVTAACLLVRAQVFDQVGGMDEGFSVAFNDVDFCLRVRDAGWRIVWTPDAELYHYESKSRGLDEKDPVKKARFDGERARLYQKHGRENIIRDPYYNPSLTLDREDFSESDDMRNLKEPV
ncbi:MAG: glycosyltransferase family 2 protein, partial [Oscillospiraceae bacterium]|nr:glycosyltransferase family 2 protein [Oscillospiraceae bacterium]